ncbi:homeodomain-interacting protein kinase 3-like [Archocentrus centrarchus]|uniref:homeodomain-interacting protein kinase 3-like n=1 Tax=Archocentrus centrarchus TaxID=63155 RepID=UPI0011EA3AAE|nr:homeodomain-interacting protein kinase 3-like [Archocentrus centrarchus]
MASVMCSNVHARDKLVPGSWLTSEFSTYQVSTILGEGTFGKVVKCVRMADKKTVAIKVTKKEAFEWMAKEELDILYKLSLYNSHEHNLTEWHRAFIDSGRTCLEFECLDKSLFDFMQERHFQPLSLMAIRPIVVQMAVALKHLKSVGIIHADLKLQNVMLVNHQQEPYRIKVIDFGLACETSAATVGSYIQSRPYRSPEIILGLPFTEAIDVWSLGNIAAYLYLGSLLYPGYTEYDMMNYIVETQGNPPEKMLNSGLKTSCFFYKEFNSTTSNWKLKTPEQFFEESGIKPTERRGRNFTSLNDLLHFQQLGAQTFTDKAAEMCDLLMFVEMVKEMLQLDPERRITPQQVLDHSFARMNHIGYLYDLSSYVKSCYQHMDICKEKSTVSSDSGTGVSGSLQQPVSESRQPAQQRLPPPAAESKFLVGPPSSKTTSPSEQNCPPPSDQKSSPKCFRPSHSETAQTVSVSNFKRKRPDEDIKDTSQPVKWRRIDWKDVGEKIPTSSEYERSDHDQRELQCSPGPSCSNNRTQSSSSGIKRNLDHWKTAFNRPHKRARKHDEGSWSCFSRQTRKRDPKCSPAEDHRCREARRRSSRVPSNSSHKSRVS